MNVLNKFLCTTSEKLLSITQVSVISNYIKSYFRISMNHEEALVTLLVKQPGDNHLGFSQRNRLNPLTVSIKWLVAIQFLYALEKWVGKKISNRFQKGCPDFASLVLQMYMSLFGEMCNNTLCIYPSFMSNYSPLVFYQWWI